MRRKKDQTIETEAPGELLEASADFTEKPKKKKIKRPRKKHTRVRIAVAIILLVMVVAVLATALVMTNVQLRTLSAQITYMQDTVKVINANVDSLESNIESTLEQETSLLEQCDISLSDISFAAGTYTVDISIVPKDYTDTTTMSVFFGADEYALEADGFHYNGSVTLPITETYAGNVTVLFTDGSSRQTEILNSYDGISLYRDDFLTAALTQDISIEDEVLTQTGQVTVNLSGRDLFTYETVEYRVFLNGVELYSADLLEAMGEESVTELDSVFDVDYSYEIPETAEGTLTSEVHVVTAEGYQMTYELSEGELLSNAEQTTGVISTNNGQTVGNKPENADADADTDPIEHTYEPTEDAVYHLVFYDRHGGSYVVLLNEEEEQETEE